MRSRAVILTTCAAVIVLAPACRSLPHNGASPTLAITGVTVIDGTGRSPRRGATVLIEGSRIAAVGAARDITVPSSAIVVDGRGKYLIPGLCDVHVHLWHGDSAASQFPAHGVTCVRDMGTPSAEITRLRHGIADGTILGPRIIAAAGPWLSATVWQGRTELARVVDGAPAATAAVESLSHAGSDFIKVMTDVPRPAFVAAFAEARKRGLRVAGHLPNGLDLGEAIEHGLNSVEHLFQLRLAFSAREHELRPRLLAALAAGDRATLTRLNAEALSSYSAEKQTEVLRLLAERGVFLTPTLVAHQWASVLGDSNFAADARLASVPDSLRRAWAVQRPAARISTEASAAARQSYAQQESLVVAMRRAGVRLMTGTDAGDAYRYNGSSLHDELMLLVRAGLTPMEAIESATRIPAEYLGVADSLGTIEPGKVADLVLLDANPLERIENVRAISAVVLRGRLLDERRLVELMK